MHACGLICLLSYAFFFPWIGNAAAGFACLRAQRYVLYAHHEADANDPHDRHAHVDQHPAVNSRQPDCVPPLHVLCVRYAVDDCALPSLPLPRLIEVALCAYVHDVWSSEGRKEWEAPISLQRTTTVRDNLVSCRHRSF